jgi:hypothetical protein
VVLTEKLLHFFSGLGFERLYESARKIAHSEFWHKRMSDQFRKANVNTADKIHIANGGAIKKYIYSAGLGMYRFFGIEV